MPRKADLPTPFSSTPYANSYSCTCSRQGARGTTGVARACAHEISAKGHFAFSKFANATAPPLARRPRASGCAHQLPPSDACHPIARMLAITWASHKLQPTHPTPRAARPAGQPLSEPSKRAIDASCAGGTPASATGAWHLNCVAGMARAACNSVNYGRSTRA